MSAPAFFVEIYTRAWERVDASSVTLRYLTGEAQATGGHTLATIAATGERGWLWAATGWLGYHVIVRDEQGTPVWWGQITRTQLNTGACRITLDLADVRNRLKVDYSYTDGDGVLQEGSTDWAENARAVGRYGALEERVPLSDADPTQAAAKRDAWLGKTQLPQPTVEWDDAAAGLLLECTGYWPLTDNIYYANEGGRLVYDAASTREHLLGWKLADHDQIAFNRKVGLKIHDLQARLGALVEGTRIDVTGTASNNASYTVTGAANPDLAYHTYTTGNVFFSSADEVYDNLDGFSVFDAGEMIFITGTDDDDDHAENDGLYILQTVEPHNIEVWPSTILDSATGQTVTFAQGHSVTVEEPPVNEFPGAATFTLRSRGVRVAQSFQIPGSVAWAAHEVQVRVRKVGAHPDPLQVRLYADDGGQPAPTPLATGTLAASEIRTVAEWVTVAFAAPYTLQPGVTYWLAVSGTDAGALTCYALGLCDDADAQYDGGAVKIQRYTDAGWETRWGDAVSMPFQIWGKTETTAQVLAILLAACPALVGGRVAQASGVWTRQYRDGTQRALYELQQLVETGGNGGLRLSVDITAQRYAVVGVETAEGAVDESAAPRFDVATGQLNRPDGGPYAPGALPYAQTVLLANAEDTHDYYSRIQRVAVERVTYEVDGNRYRLESRQRRRPWETS